MKGSNLVTSSNKFCEIHFEINKIATKHIESLINMNEIKYTSDVYKQFHVYIIN